MKLVKKGVPHVHVTTETVCLSHCLSLILTHFRKYSCVPPLTASLSQQIDHHSELNEFRSLRICEEL